MSEINSNNSPNLKTKIKSTGTLEQIDLFRDLPPEQKNIENFRYMDSYAQARAFKYLPDELRTEEVYQSLKCDKSEAFSHIFYGELKNDTAALNMQIMKNFEELKEEEKCQAFKTLPEENRTYSNLSKIPKKDRACAFENLEEEEKTAENWFKLPASTREEGVYLYRVSENTARLHETTKQYSLKKVLFSVGLLIGILAFLAGITLIVLYIFCPPVAAIINLAIGVTYGLVISCTTGSMLTLGGIIVGFLCIKNLIQTLKNQNQLINKYNSKERDSVDSLSKQNSKEEVKPKVFKKKENDIGEF